MRNSTRLVRCTFAWALCVTPFVVHAQSNTVTAEFQSLLVARYNAIAHADTAALSPYLADNMNWIVIANAGGELSKRQLLTLAAQPQVPMPRYDVDSVHAQRLGDVAIVEYRRRDLRQKGNGVDTLSVHVQEVFAQRNGRWLLVRHTQSWIFAPATQVAIDSASLNAFVGHYQIAPGYVDNVHWEGNQLVATASVQTVGARLVPVSTTAFSPDGVGAVIVFERDSTGRVLGYVQGYPNGQVIRATRLP